MSSEYEELAPFIYRATYGEVTGLPAPQGVIGFIVSGMVKAACPERYDLLVPATGHPEAVRKDGNVYSVPGFIVS